MVKSEINNRDHKFTGDFYGNNYVSDNTIKSIHPLYCKKHFPIVDWCDVCRNNEYLYRVYKNVDILPTMHLERREFPTSTLLVPKGNLSLIYPLSHLAQIKNGYSLSLFHREAIQCSSKYQDLYSNAINNSKTLSLHFTEYDEFLIRQMSRVAILKIIDEVQPNFVFTPEIGYKIAGSKHRKIKAMLAYASIIGQKVPICFMFPGYTPKTLKSMISDVKRLNPSAIGIYGGNSNFHLLYKNIKVIRDHFCEKPLYVVSIKSTSKIKNLIERGVTNFALSGWYRIGPTLKLFDVERKKWINYSEKYIEKCTCNICQNIESLFTAHPLSHTQNRTGVKVRLHNIINLTNYIKELRR